MISSSTTRFVASKGYGIEEEEKMKNLGSVLDRDMARLVRKWPTK